jgi:hypothetical protein
VLSEGLSKKWSYKFGKTERGKRSLNEDESRERRELRQKVAQILEIVKKQVAKKMTSFIPTIVQALGNWEASGRLGQPPIPNMISSNSNNAAVPNVLVPPAANIAEANVMVPPASNSAVANELSAPIANIAAPELNAPTGTAQRSSPSITCTPTYVGGPSTTPKLDAIKVTKLWWLNLHVSHCVTSILG